MVAGEFAVEYEMFPEAVSNGTVRGGVDAAVVQCCLCRVKTGVVEPIDDTGIAPTALGSDCASTSASQAFENSSSTYVRSTIDLLALVEHRPEERMVAAPFERRLILPAVTS